MRKPTNECVVTAFYGVEAPDPSLEILYNELVRWFHDVDCPPDKLSVKAPGFSGKPGAFSATDSRLQRTGFSNVKSLDIYSMLPNGDTPTVDWWATASLSLDYQPWFFLASRRTVSSLDDERLVRVVKYCVSTLKPVYGIGYHRDHDKGASFFAIGLLYSDINQLGKSTVSEKEEDAISRWGQVGMADEVFRNGVLRDIYPYNYLTAIHLAKRVCGQTLRAWISSELSRGTLSKVNDRVTLWKVPKSRIVPVRKALSTEGILFE